MRPIYPEGIWDDFKAAEPYLVVEWGDKGTTHHFIDGTPQNIIDGFYKAMNEMEVFDKEAAKECGRY